MRITFRTKLGAIVGAIMLAFLALIVASTAIADRANRELVNIQERFLPRIELGPQLEGKLEHLQRALQDAVAAHDLEALEATVALKNDLLERFLAARGVITPGEAAALRSAVEDYYASAHDVSRRLLTAETGEGLVEAMEAMQAKQPRTVNLLRTTTAIDRGQLASAFSEAARAQVTANQVRLIVSLGCLAVVLLLSIGLGRSTLRSLAALAVGLNRFGKGDFGQPIPVVSQDELGDLARQANQMAENLNRLGQERDRSDWIKGGQAGLAEEVRGELEPEETAARAVRFLARYLDVPVAALYVTNPDGSLRLLGHCALSAVGAPSTGAATLIRPGEGLLGHAAQQREIIVVADPPADYLCVRSGLGEARTRAIVLVPLVHAGRVTGVLELGLFTPWTDRSAELLGVARETLAIAIEVSRARSSMRGLLAETQRQADRLAEQEMELRATNEELQSQQEEVRRTNADLKQQTEELETQQRALQEKNEELETARLSLEQKAAELTTVSTYKSQFLSNMSHELRTPLNSMLLLSSLLAENETGRLTDKQVEFAKTIHLAGKDLLKLINQVLDLAKIESGRQEIHVEPVELSGLVDRIGRVFEPLATDKGLAFSVELEPGLPQTIATDRQRIDQVLNNLLANAIKFTAQGGVALHIRRPAAGAHFQRDGLRPDNTVAFVVTDSGVGIAAENLDRIFTPFEQIDSAIDRRYGGTGLGLGIARELCHLLGGELQVESVMGKGSTFTCLLPDQGPSASEKVRPPVPVVAAADPDTERSGAPLVAPGDAYLLLVEDDPNFAKAFGEIIQGQGLKYVIAPDGKTGLRLARDKPPAGIILDVRLPDSDGWTLMNQLRADPATKQIPVHFVSAVDASEHGLGLGAVGYLTKPATRQQLIQVVEALVPKPLERTARILVVEDDVVMGDSLVKQLTGENLEVRRAMNAQEALQVISQERIGCLILDLSLPDMDGVTFLRALETQCGPDMPSIVVYTARALSKAEAKALEAYTDAIVLKDGSSAERLLDEVRLFVRRLKEGLGPRRQTALPTRPATAVRLEGRKILVVDDDMRTVYALSATLRSKGAEVFVADTGHAALAELKGHPDVEAVLMDIMMPEMDGYEAMRRIRQEQRFRDLPIIALTAKAMKGERETCIEAGASDYLPKPVDPDRLITMLHACISEKVKDGRPGA